MSGRSQEMWFKIAGLLFVFAGVIYTARGKIPLGMMDFAVGTVFIVLGIRKAGRMRGGDRVESSPLGNNTEDHEAQT
jgi:hypothetical protein